MVRSVLEINKPKSAPLANGSAGIDVKQDVLEQMQHRVVTSNPTTEQLYQSVAWSVHNKLVDAFEKTDAYWK